MIAALDAPLAAEGGIAVVRGSLAPDGALIKRSAASPELLRHRGPAVVFEDVYDVAARIDDPALDVGPDSVLVLRNSGPKGGPGMPEWGQLPIPKKLLQRGISDLVRISDARMSGTAFGTVVLHVAPEAAVGGPLRAVRDGDPIVLDVDEQRLDLDLPAAEIERRLAELGPSEPKYRRGYGALYLEHVQQANEGCDFDFLRGNGEPADASHRSNRSVVREAAGSAAGDPLRSLTPLRDVSETSQVRSVTRKSPDVCRRGSGRAAGVRYLSETCQRPPRTKWDKRRSRVGADAGAARACACAARVGRRLGGSGQVVRFGG